MKVYYIAKDGNCLFHAVNHQLRLKNPHHTETHLQLRAETVQFIQEHVTDFIPTLLDSCKQVYTSNQITGQTTQQLILRYLSDLEKDGFWGGAECLSAISQLKNTRINVHHSVGHNIIAFTPHNGNYASEIHLLYSGTHYDSLMSPTHSQPLSDITNSGSSFQNIKNNITRRFQTYNNPYILIDETQNNPHITPINSKSICFGTWNIRGLCDFNKRNQIDDILSAKHIDICGIQETNMGSGICTTTNYIWYLSNNPGAKRRGVGILVKQNSDMKVRRIKYHLGSIITIFGYIPGQGEILFINTYVPSPTSKYNRQKSSKIFSKLFSLIDLCPKSRDIIILGDFNAHLGSQDTWNEKNIGTKLYHKETNENGNSLGLLVQSTNLFIHTTTGRHRSLTTWTDGRNNSQIDHIITRQNNRTIYVKSVKVDAFNSKISDHRLIWIDCTHRKHKYSSRSLPCCSKPTSSVSPITYNFKTLNLQLLQDEKIRDTYQSTVTSTYGQISLENRNLYSWKSINDSLKIASQIVLTQRTPLTPKRRQALSKFKSARHYHRTHPQDPHALVSLRTARQCLTKAYSDHRLLECQEFFTNLIKHKPSDRVRKSYLFLKQHIRRNKTTNKRYIPISSWVSELRKSEGEWPDLIEETDLFPLGAPPTIDEIRSTIKFLRSGTAPGIDGVPIELYKHAPENILEAFQTMIEKIWINNELPSEWIETLQVPLPKTKQPKDTNDYRRITLCNVGYKIYSKILLDRLDEFLDPPLSYQAAFLANRSAEDHMFTIRRVLDEEWRSGNRIYILSIDLAKAFDTVDLNIISICLQQYIPHYLVNRIIKACFWEKTSIKWFNVCTEQIKKNKGVKQGCPISPRIFNFILNEVLLTVADQFPELQLEQRTNIHLPLILAYADDILLVARNLTSIEPILAELIDNLKYVGLEINPQKCTTTIRDPDSEFVPPQTISLAGVTFTHIKMMRYLGTYLTSTLSRPYTIRTRCQQAIGTTKQMQAFIKRYRLPFNTALLMYKTVIVPSLTYGLKTAALTFANRRRLRKYELFLLNQILKFTTNKPITRKVKDLLEGKTITKRIKVHRINYWGHIYRRDPSHILKAASTYTAGRKKIGRPCLTWNDSLRQDLRYYSKSLNEWEALLPLRAELRKAADEIYSIEESDSSESLENEDENQQDIQS